MHNIHSPNLFETRYGAVLKCQCCGRLQITFREHTLLLDEDEFATLVRTLHRAWEEVRADANADRWRLEAGTDAGMVSIVLSEPSLRALHTLLRGAWQMYTLRERVHAVASGRPHDVLRDHVAHASPFEGGN